MSAASEACEEAARRIRAGECIECGVKLGPDPPVRGWCDACYFAPDSERRPTLLESEADAVFRSGKTRSEIDPEDAARFNADVARLRKGRADVYAQYARTIVREYDGTRAYLERAWIGAFLGMRRSGLDNLALAVNMAEAHESARFWEAMDAWVRECRPAVHRALHIRFT